MPLALSWPDPPMRSVAYAVYGLIALGSTAGIVHPGLRRPESRRVRQAINSWWPTALLCGVTTLGGRTVGFGVFVCLSAWALVEYLRLLPLADRPPLTTALAITCVPLHYAAIASGRGELAGGAVLLGWAFAVMPLARAFARGPVGLVAGSARVGFGLALTVFAVGHAARLLLLPARVGPAGGAGVLCFLLVTVMISDASQFVWGKLLGRRRLAPVLSPNKTWEGLAGGMLTTALVAAWVGSRVTPFSALAGALVGVALCALGVLGDLLVSALKRDLGVKDTGAVLPGQGGVLDRTDSLLIAAPVFYHGFVAWIG